MAGSSFALRRLPFPVDGSAVRTAEIIAVGSELLTPHRIDTNSLFLTGRLNELGILVRVKAVVGDDAGDLGAVIRQALTRADLVVTTGGLGPTADDLTREVVADVLGLPLEEHTDIVETIRARFARRGIKMPEINRRQGMVPKGALPLANPHGSAPGLLLEVSGRLVVLLPGPPRELQPMFDSYVAPRLAPLAAGRRLARRVIKVTGRSESQVEEIAFPIYSRLGDERAKVDTTILAAPGQIELHVSASGTEEQVLNERLDKAVAELAEALGSAVFSVDGGSLEAVVGDLLRDRAWRMAVAESCTGGGLLSRLTDVAGSSAWVVGGVVAYANSVKVNDLGVPAGLIAAHGAVSEPVARAMAEGVKAKLGTEVGVAVTGIAGPGGGTPEKPVGTVVIAVSTSETRVRTFVFAGDREVIRRFATTTALDMVRLALRA
jgi:competence/damage-inducible protein CinA-like protein